jgi:hypothetical protein
MLETSYTLHIWRKGDLEEESSCEGDALITGKEMVTILKWISGSLIKLLTGFML